MHSLISKHPVATSHSLPVMLCQPLPATCGVTVSFPPAKQLPNTMGQIRKCIMGITPPKIIAKTLDAPIHAFDNVLYIIIPVKSHIFREFYHETIQPFPAWIVTKLFNRAILAIESLKSKSQELNPFRDIYDARFCLIQVQ